MLKIKYCFFWSLQKKYQNFKNNLKLYNKNYIVFSFVNFKKNREESTYSKTLKL